MSALLTYDSQFNTRASVGGMSPNNSLPPVPPSLDTLPNELLSDIFVWYAIETSKSHSASMRRRPQPRGYYGWGDIMLVCRRWRDVALSSPALWRAVDVKLSTQRRALSEDSLDNDAETQNPFRWLELILPRTAKATLELVFGSPAVAIAALPKLNAESSRIGTLVVPNDIYAAAVHSFLKLEMPRLVEFEFLNISWPRFIPTSDSWKCVKGLSAQRFPALRVLRLSNCRFDDEAVMLFPQLQCLDLRSCSFHGHPSTLDHLFDVIRRCINLHELQLHQILRTLNDTARHNAHVLSLDRLYKLVICDQPCLTSRFLAHVTLSVNTTLRVIGMMDIPPDDESYDTLFPSLLPADLSGLPLIPTLTSGSIHNWQDVARLKCHRGPTKLSLKLIFPEDSTQEDLPACLHAFRTLFGQARALSCLYIAGNIGTVRTTQTWVDALACWPALGELELVGDGSALSAVCALGYPPDGAGEAARRLPVCPALRVLRLEYLNWELGLTQALAATLRRRAMCQLPRLSQLELTLGLGTLGDPDECPLAMSLYGDEIHSYVERFRWTVD